MFESLKELKTCQDKERQARREIDQRQEEELARMHQDFEEKRAQFEKEYAERERKYDNLQEKMNDAMARGDIAAVKSIFDEMLRVHKG